MYGDPVYGAEPSADLEERLAKMEAIPGALTFLLPIDALNSSKARFDAPDAATFTIPRTMWEALGRPARVTIEVKEEQA